MTDPEQVKVEKGIPIPLRGGWGKWQTLLKSMEIGDSFLLNSDAERDCILRVNCAKKLKFRVVSRKIDGHGYRIWRVK